MTIWSILHPILLPSNNVSFAFCLTFYIIRFLSLIVRKTLLHVFILLIILITFFDILLLINLCNRYNIHRLEGMCCRYVRSMIICLIDFDCLQSAIVLNTIVRNWFLLINVISMACTFRLVYVTVIVSLLIYCRVIVSVGLSVSLLL